MRSIVGACHSGFSMQKSSLSSLVTHPSVLTAPLLRASTFPFSFLLAKRSVSTDRRTGADIRTHLLSRLPVSGPLSWTASSNPGPRPAPRRSSFTRRSLLAYCSSWSRCVRPPGLGRLKKSEQSRLQREGSRKVSSRDLIMAAGGGEADSETNPREGANALLIKGQRIQESIYRPNGKVSVELRSSSRTDIFSIDSLL